MARKLKAAGLWDVKTEKDSPVKVVPTLEPRVEPREESEEPASEALEDSTLYNFTFRLTLRQREALDKAGRRRRKRTSPGKGAASEVLREIIDAWMEGQT